jgi:crotonobetainyl-CoA hydratase
MSLNHLSTDDVKIVLEDGIATITIDRQKRLNAMQPAAHHAMEAILDAIAAEPTARVVILTGAGDRAFCAGYDLRDSIESDVMELAKKGFGGLTNRTDYPLPIIASVNGIAMGGGFEMALACDFIVASSNASFALPEPKVGWAALSGGVQRLPRAIGIKRAMDIILTGRTVSAEEGFALGLVSEIVAPDELAAATLRWAAQIAANAPLALRCSKQIAYAALDQAEPGATLDIGEWPEIKQMLESEDSVEGRTAFLEKRKPVWKGR